MRRVLELDAIRGLTALAIVLFHARPEASFPWSRVDLFLILSGYLVTTIVLKYGNTEGFLSRFYARRVLRIWPGYFLALGVLLAFNPFLNQPMPLEGLGYYLTFTQNISTYWGADIPQFSIYFFHTWTLAVIEQFTLVWPALILFFGRRWLVPLGLGFVALAVTTRGLGLSAWVVLGRCDGMALGGILAALLNDDKRIRQHLNAYRLAFAVLAVPSLVLLFAVGDLKGLDANGVTTLETNLTILTGCLLYFGLIGLVICHSGHWLLAPLRDRRLVFLGTISYGIYLYHPLTITAVARVARGFGFGPSSWGMEFAKLTASVLVAAIAWKLYERPLSALKGRLAFQKRETPTPVEPPVSPSTIESPSSSGIPIH